ncbi:1,2-dihydroxy-3-keto-5-methylthiopentene dioxygenase [Obba rivulosa]|uniref:Acireductone dioxygenase n=1 Tax=Obba rivulosa TaxID=1052685 RepID=A0A8E2AUV1_9APHY|nr:1,2-dihydroxy-3-keto-5-methylthiopentene dioxygenase [Obba rivulosa]
MRSYYFDDLPGDQPLPHDSTRPVSEETLTALGVLYTRVPVDAEGRWEDRVNDIATERAYCNHDVMSISKEGLGDEFEATMKMFYEEHLHEDEEIIYILEGSGFFDVREHATDAWVRMHLEAGDMMVLPAGIYHRFTLDMGNKTRTMRLFKDEPKKAHPRGGEADVNPSRVEYLKSFPGITSVA